VRRFNGEDLSNHSRLNQLKWLIKAYQTTNDKSKFFNPFLPNLQEQKNYNSK
jgi:hypothetical protein